MTQHLHSTHVEGCYRCDLSRDEATTQLGLTRDQARKLADHYFGLANAAAVPEHRHDLTD